MKTAASGGFSTQRRGMLFQASRLKNRQTFSKAFPGLETGKIRGQFLFPDWKDILQLPENYYRTSQQKVLMTHTPSAFPEK